MLSETLKWSLIFAVALFGLIKSADWFTIAAEKIGLHFKIPPFIIGVTIIAFGTSLPEVATSVSSVFHGYSEIVIGNVVGSNIANILLVLAITAIVGKILTVDKEIISIDLPILLGSSLLLYVLTLNGEFTYLDGILSLLALVVYMLYNIKSHRKIDTIEMKELEKASRTEKKSKLSLLQPLILIATGFAMSITANYTIEAVIHLSEILNLAKEVIAVSAVAIGTSLPELVVSVIAAKKGKADIAIGNVTGSNIFNVLGVMGVPALFGNLTITESAITFTIPFLIFITILYVFVTIDKKITEWEGYTLLLIYVAFLGVTFHII